MKTAGVLGIMEGQGSTCRSVRHRLNLVCWCDLQRHAQACLRCATHMRGCWGMSGRLGMTCRLAARQEVRQVWPTKPVGGGGGYVSCSRSDRLAVQPVGGTGFACGLWHSHSTRSCAQRAPEGWRCIAGIMMIEDIGRVSVFIPNPSPVYMAAQGRQKLQLPNGFHSAHNLLGSTVSWDGLLPRSRCAVPSLCCPLT